uniref:Prothymosin alpha n=2 Tax=Sus scrofa TaxID=9823 RepID=A0A8D1ZLM3_PIG
MSDAAVDTSSEITTKDLKEKKEVVEEAENGREAPANGNANEENGEQEADNEVDEEEEEGGEEEEEEEEGDGEEEDGDEDEEAEAATGKRAAEDDEKNPKRGHLRVESRLPARPPRAAPPADDVRSPPPHQNHNVNLPQGRKERTKTSKALLFFLKYFKKENLFVFFIYILYFCTYC